MSQPDTLTLGPEPRPPEQQFWDPEMQTLSRERLRDLQDERVRQLVRAIFERPVPLFRDRLRDAGIAADDIKGVDDLSHVPLTRKQDLRDSEAQHPPFGDYRFTSHTDCVRVGTSTGTTGTPTTMLWTRRDLWLECESAARNWWRYGWRPGQVVTHAHPAYLYGGGMLLSQTLEYFGLLNVWVPPPETDDDARKGIAMWERVRPDLSMVAFSLGRFMEVAAKDGKDLTADGILPGFTFHGGGGKGLPLMTAGLECYAYVAGPCQHSPGGHVHEDWAVVQAVDPDTGREVPDGEWGDMVVTTLGRDNGLLRYDLEEAAMIVRDPCPCGETTIRAFWGGRFKDLLAVQGRHLQLPEIEAALRAVGPVVTKPSLEYVIIRPTSADEALRIRIEKGDPGVADDDVARSVAVALTEHLGLVSRVEVLPRETLARSSYKATRVVDA